MIPKHYKIESAKLVSKNCSRFMHLCDRSLCVRVYSTLYIWEEILLPVYRFDDAPKWRGWVYGEQDWFGLGGNWFAFKSFFFTRVNVLSWQHEGNAAYTGVMSTRLQETNKHFNALQYWVLKYYKVQLPELLFKWSSNFITWTHAPQHSNVINESRGKTEKCWWIALLMDFC